MTAAASHPGTPLWPIVATTVFCSLLTAFYTVVGVEPAPIVVIGFQLLPFIACSWWVQRDAREHRIGFAQDWGLLAWVAWPLLIPWYAFSTRGRPGWRLALGLYVAFLAP